MLIQNKNMNAIYKNLGNIKYVTDTDVGYYDVGEIEGSFDENDLEEYIKSYGIEQLCKQLTYMQYQIWDSYRKINHENEKNDVCCNMK